MNGRNLPSPYSSELPYRFFFCQLFLLCKSSFCSVSQNSHFWPIPDCLVQFHSSQEEWFLEQSKGEELKVHDRLMFLYYSVIYIVDITAIQMESFSMHMYSKELNGGFFPLWELKFCLYSSFSCRLSWRKRKEKWKIRPFQNYSKCIIFFSRIWFINNGLTI